MNTQPSTGAAPSMSAAPSTDRSASAPTHLHTMRQQNLGTVLLQLVRAPGSRADLAQRTGLTKATVASLVDPLIAGDVLEEGTPESNGRGRPSRELRFHPNAPVAIGAEINVDYLAVATLSLDGQVRHSRRIEGDNRDLSAREMSRRMAKLIAALRDEVSQPILGVGLAVPGVADGPEVLRAPNLPALAGHRPGVVIADLLDLADVPIDNESNLAARAHLWPHPVGEQDFVYVSGEIGVGAGLVIHGELYRGASGFAGELGHVVVDRSGPRCGCGGQGCVEQYAGQTAMLRAANRRDLTGLLRALAGGDVKAERAVSAAGSALGVGLASLLNVCDLPQVVLGGIYADLFDALKPALTAELDRRVLATSLRPIEVRPSAYGGGSAVRGAAGMLTYRACREPERLTAAVG